MEPPACKPRVLLSGLCAGLLLSMLPHSATGKQVTPSFEEVVQMIDNGQFEQAQDILQDWITAAANGAGGDVQDLSFQQERMRRIQLDFSLDEAATKAALRRWIPDLDDAEFARWDALGLLEHLDINGERRWFKRAPANLFRLSSEARARRRADAPMPADGPYEHLHPRHLQVVQAAQRAQAPSVLPQRVEVTQSLTVKADAVPAGEIIRAWIPYPQAIAGQQENLRLLGSTPAGAKLSTADAAHSTAFLQATAVAGQPTRFELRYALTVYAQHTAIDPATVVPLADPAAFADALAEQPPHIRFTPALRQFSAQVLQGETRPYEIVRRLYAAVDQIPWAGAREYSTLSNLSAYALQAGHADCGQQTLLLITLLRMNGIPARWQSGMVFSDNATGYSNLHDWGQVYLAPYGWLPMDVTSGALDSDVTALRTFYLGSQEGYRIAFNSDIGQPLQPAKQHFRSDTVDSQRGEAEWAGGNLYFDQWDYQFQWQVLPSAGKP